MQPEAAAATRVDPAAPPAGSTEHEGAPFESPGLPLTRATIFPETMVPLAVGRPASMAAVEAALFSEEKLLACVSVRPEKTSEGDPGPEDLYEIGTLVMSKRMEGVGDPIDVIGQGDARTNV